VEHKNDTITLIADVINHYE